MPSRHAAKPSGHDRPASANERFACRSPGIRYCLCTDQQTVSVGHGGAYNYLRARQTYSWYSSVQYCSAYVRRPRAPTVPASERETWREISVHDFPRGRRSSGEEMEGSPADELLRLLRTLSLEELAPALQEEELTVELLRSMARVDGFAESMAEIGIDQADADALSAALAGGGGASHTPRVSASSACVQTSASVASASVASALSIIMSTPTAAADKEEPRVTDARPVSLHRGQKRHTNRAILAQAERTSAGATPAVSPRQIKSSALAAYQAREGTHPTLSAAVAKARTLPTQARPVVCLGP